MNTFSKRDEQKERTRARILEVARAHFEAHGFEAANLRAIASECGVAPGTVLLHFQDKRTLLNAALFDDLSVTIARALARPARGPLLRDLVALTRAFLGYYARRPVLGRTLLKEALLADPPWNARFAEQGARVHAHVVRLVEAARDRGEPGLETLDATRVGLAFLSFYYFALLAWVQGAHPKPLTLVEDLLAQHLGRTS